MKRYPILSVFLLTLSCSVCFAQGTAPAAAPAVIEDFKPSSFNQPHQDYPMVNSQGYARFRVVAPKAKTVRVSLGLGATPGQTGTLLAKGADGIFMGTTANPLDEGFHYYHLQIDSSAFVNDP